jgi:hypothetical protein
VWVERFDEALKAEIPGHGVYRIHWGFAGY